ncbi:MAG: DUF6468 domain-containing protein [Parvularculaceae bacterium]
MTIGLAVDIALIALILTAGAFALVLNGRLKKLAEAQATFEASLEKFTVAAARADDALKRIESQGIVRGAELQAAANRAQRLATELSVMATAGERVADRIEAALNSVRAVGAAARKDRRAA